VVGGRRFAAEEGPGGRVDFRVGDAHCLGLPAGGFDVVVMHTLISHVADPAAVLAEARRLLRPGSGRLVVFDGDFASITFATDAADGGAATDSLVQSMVAANPRIMRAMPRRLAEGGLDLIWSRGYVAADIGRADFWAPSFVSFRVLLPKAGAMSEAEANAFVDELERDSAGKRFFGASNFYQQLLYVSRETRRIA
jgi:SAM-dependent methyltransferase